MTHPRSFEPAGATVTGYDRAALERYFAAVDAERHRLHAEIAAARARVVRARTALDARRVLVTMVERTVDEITAKRRQADLVVGRIAAGAVAPSDGAVPPRRVAPTPTVAEAAPVDIRWQWGVAGGMDAPDGAPRLAPVIEAVAR